MKKAYLRSVQALSQQKKNNNFEKVLILLIKQREFVVKFLRIIFRSSNIEEKRDGGNRT